MKLNALQALVAAIEDGSLRRAGKRLGYSQPALTKMIKDLELELTAPLLVRNTRGVVPTIQGKLLFEHARRVKQEIDNATQKIARLGGSICCEVNITSVPVALMLLVPEAMRTFAPEFPEVHLRVNEELYLEQLQQLRSGAVDIAVGGAPPNLAQGEFHVEELMSTTMIVVAGKGSRHARSRSLHDLANAKWVDINTATDSGYTKDFFKRWDIPAPPIGAVVNSTLALLALIATGDYVGLVPEQIMHHALASGQIESVPIKETGLPIRIDAIVRASNHVTPAVRHFIAQLHRAAKRYGYCQQPRAWAA